jgi:PTH1 family peptidyl-tRNA hydrolase
VLKDFGTVEKKELPFLVDDAADSVELLIRDGLTATQQKFHAPAWMP